MISEEFLKIVLCLRGNKLNSKMYSNRKKIFKILFYSITVFDVVLI